MSDENLSPDEEVQDTTPHEEGGSDDASELDLFEDDAESQDETKEESSNAKDTEIAELKKEVARLSKGFDKAFSEKGQKDKASTPAKEETENNDLVEDYIDRHPEMESVMDDAKEIAKTTGRSLYSVLRNEKWLQDKANSISEVNKEKAEANRNITKPSANAGPTTSQKDVANMSPEEFKAYKESVMQR